VIEIIEQTFIKNKKRYRPFLKKSKVKNKTCSKMLQRAICDFASDCSFEKTQKKLKEHYKVEICTETIRKITLYHAKKAKEINHKQNQSEDITKLIIAETDGSMVPLVETLENIGDKRKNRKLFWKEYRLATLQAQGSVNWLYAASDGSLETLENNLRNISSRVGYKYNTKVLAIGDGALWVKELMEKVYGCNAQFLIDFFHLCDYLANASEAFENKNEWIKHAKDTVKSGKIETILSELKTTSKKRQNHEGLNRCIKYIENRKGQFEYKVAIDKKLPIGSGKIESSHRNIIQQRLKKPGAWWKQNSAENMINLRILRANGDWERLWNDQNKENLAA